MAEQAYTSTISASIRYEFERMLTATRQAYPEEDPFKVIEWAKGYLKADLEILAAGEERDKVRQAVA